jgi:glycosyltransferase involved in cell wall biosynthesis
MDKVVASGKLAKSHISLPDNILQNNILKCLDDKFDDLNIVSVVSDAIGLDNPSDLDDSVKADFLKIKDGGLLIYYLRVVRAYWKKIKQLVNESDGDVVVMAYGAQIWTALPALFAKITFRAKYGAVIIAATQVDGGLVEKIISAIAVRLQKHVDFSLTSVEKYVEDHTDKPYLFIPMILADKDIANYKKNFELYKNYHSTTPTIAFTGQLWDISGGDIMLDLIKKLKGKYKWVVCGSGQYEKEFAELSKKPEYDLEYLGRVSKAKVSEVQNKADLLVVFRPTNTEEMRFRSKYANSSKISEYILTGKPVLATDVESIPKDQRKYLNLIGPENDIDEIINEMDAILEHGKGKNSDEGRKFAELSSSIEYQENRIADFIKKECKKP